MTGPYQHYVPQYYLKTFANEDGLYVFDKKKKDFLSQNRIPVSKIAFAKNFYDLDPKDLSKFLINETDNRLFVDNLIGKYNEQVSAPLINSFIDLGEMVYVYKEMNIVSLIRSNDIIDFLMVQLFRTPFFRKQFEFIARDIHKKHFDKTELRRRHSIDLLSKTVHGVYIISAICNTDIWKNSHNKHLLKPQFRFIELEVIDKFKQLKKMSKSLCVSAIDSYFLTSDNPIVISQTRKGNINLLYFPITKRCSISFSKIKETNKSVIIINDNRKKVLLEQNRVMRDWAYRFIYSYDK